MVSANPIIGVDVLQEKLIIGKKFGLTNIFKAGSKNLDDKINRLVGGKGADVVIETTGNSKIIEKAYNLTSPDGKTILVGVPSRNINIYSLSSSF